MYIYGLGKQIVSHTFHHAGVGSEVLSSGDEVGSHEGDGEVLLVHDEHSHQSFVTIDDEVASEFSKVLSFFDELFLREAVEVAEF